MSSHSIGKYINDTFSFKREHDQWINQELVSEDIREQAIDALDRYLFKQH